LRGFNVKQLIRVRISEAEEWVMKKYSKEHQWVLVEGETALIGITKYASEQLGHIVFVELPAVGEQVSAGEPLAMVESVKSASDVYAPVSGEVLMVKEELNDMPDMLNQDPEGEVWIAVLRVR